MFNCAQVCMCTWKPEVEVRLWTGMYVYVEARGWSQVSSSILLYSVYFFVLRQDLSMWPYLSWNTQSSVCWLLVKGTPPHPPVEIVSVQLSSCHCYGDKCPLKSNAIILAHSSRLPRGGGCMGPPKWGRHHSIDQGPKLKRSNGDEHELSSLSASWL